MKHQPITTALPQSPWQLYRRGDYLVGSFTAMASPCELLMDTVDLALGQSLTELAWRECQRIEAKFSRYKPDNLMAKLNASNGKPVSLDAETHSLLSFAQTCFELSEGMFDITSGVLRRAWTFDGSDRLAEANAVEALLPLIGWNKVTLDNHSLTLQPGMELDLGGIGKEYAVDRVSQLCQQQAPELSVVVNFGGDIQVTRPRRHQAFWQIGIENPDPTSPAPLILQIRGGGLATSGDARRFLLKDGVRYSHILNPKTGYPIINAPRSVTVAAGHCTQAGLLATLALLHGDEARTFLDQQGVKYWLLN